MTRIRVFIGTTEGPSEVQRITEEDADLRSVVCLDGKAEVLAVSAAYDVFVRQPTGVIERHFGHPVYRVDVSRPIAGGFSWQLGLFVAHALNAVDRLAGEDEGAEGAYWLTGEVDHDLTVRQVEHVRDKLRRSRSLFSELTSRGVRLSVCVPRRNIAEAVSALAEQGIDENAIRTVGVEKTATLLTDLNITMPRPAVSEPNTLWERIQATGRVRKVVGAFTFLLLVVAGGMSVGAWYSGIWQWHALAQTGDYDSLHRAFVAIDAGNCAVCKAGSVLYRVHLKGLAPPTDSITLSAIEERAPLYRTCGAAHFDPDDTRRRDVARAGPGVFTQSEGTQLCALEYAVESVGITTHTWLVAVPDSAGRKLWSEALFASYGPLSTGEKRVLRIRIPSRLDDTMRQHVIVFAASKTLGAFAAWIGELVRSNSMPAWDQFESQLSDLGITVLTVVHDVTPAQQRFR